MAANRNGRVIYLDAAGTYNALFDAKEFVQIDFVLVYDPTSTEVGTLTLYAAPTAASGKQIGVFTTTGPESEQFTLGPGEMVPPDSFGGLTAVLAGTSAVAWIYCA